MTQAAGGPRGDAVLRSTAVQAGLKAATLVVTLVSVALLTRYLGTDDYGQLVLAGSYTLLVVALADLGLPLLVTRELSRGGPASDRLVVTSLYGRLAFAPVVYGAALAIAAVLFDGEVLLVVAVSLVALVPTTAASALTPLFQVSMRLGTLAALELASRLLSLGVAVGVVVLGGGLLDLLWWGLAVSALNVAATVRLAGGRAALRGRPDARQFLALTRTALPLGIAATLNALYARIDGVLLAVLRPIDEVAQYLLAYRVMEMGLVFAGLLASAALPTLSRAALVPDELAGVLDRYLALVLLTVAPLGIGLTVAAPPLVALLGGVPFADAAGPLRLLGIAFVVTAFNILLGLAIIALDLQGRALWLNISGLVLNVVLNLLLVPSLGAAGAAGAVVASEVYVLAGALLIVYRGTGRLPQLRGWLRTVLALGAAALVGHLALRWGLVAGTVAGAAVYAGVLVGIGVVRPRQVRSLLRP